MAVAPVSIDCYSIPKNEVDDLKATANPTDIERDFEIRLHFTDGHVGSWVASLNSLAESSPYFAALVNFKEGRDKAVDIFEIDHEGFKCILKWHDDKSGILCSRSSLSLAKQLIHAYMVADRFMLDRYQFKALRGLKRLQCSKSVTTVDLIYAAELGVPLESPLMECLLERVGWRWSYTEDICPKGSEHDPLIFQGGELAWRLLNKFWQAHHAFEKKKLPNMYDNYYSAYPLPSTGIARLKALQKQEEAPCSATVQARIEYTISQLRPRVRLNRLDLSFKDFVQKGGSLVWKFVRLWVASCRCQLRTVTREARSPLVEPTFWHLCRYHKLTGGKCCEPKSQERCECLASPTVKIEIAIPKIDQYGMSKWESEAVSQLSA